MDVHSLKLLSFADYVSLIIGDVSKIHQCFLPPTILCDKIIYDSRNWYSEELLNNSAVQWTMESEGKENDLQQWIQVDKITFKYILTCIMLFIHQHWLWLCLFVIISMEK